MKREGIVINGIYKHYKGGYYKVIDVAYSHDDLEPYVVYHRSYSNGIFKKIRQEGKIVPQPFLRSVGNFLDNAVGGYPGNPAIRRFEFVKGL